MRIFLLNDKKNIYSVKRWLFLNFGHKNTQVYNVGIGLNFFLRHSCIFPKIWSIKIKCNICTNIKYNVIQKKCFGDLLYRWVKTSVESVWPPNRPRLNKTALKDPDKICLFFMQENLIGAVEVLFFQLFHLPV